MTAGFELLAVAHPGMLFPKVTLPNEEAVVITAEQDRCMRLRARIIDEQTQCYQMVSILHDVVSNAECKPCAYRYENRYEKPELRC